MASLPTGQFVIGRAREGRVEAQADGRKAGRGGQADHFQRWHLQDGEVPQTKWRIAGREIHFYLIVPR